MHFSLMHWRQVSTKMYIQVTVSVFFLSQHSNSHLSTCRVFSHSLQSATFYKIFFFFDVFFSFLPFLYSFLSYSFYIFFSCTVCPFSQSFFKSLYLLWFINPQWKWQSNAFIWKPISFTVRSLENSQETCEDKNNWPLLKICPG